jgi:hypothetical protein
MFKALFYHFLFQEAVEGRLSQLPGPKYDPSRVGKYHLREIKSHSFHSSVVNKSPLRIFDIFYIKFYSPLEIFDCNNGQFPLLPRQLLGWLWGLQIYNGCSTGGKPQQETFQICPPEK